MSVVTPYLLLLKDRVHKRHQVFQSCEWDFAHQLLSPMEMQIAKEYLELSLNSHQIAQKIKIYWNVKNIWNYHLILIKLCKKSKYIEMLKNASRKMKKYQKGKSEEKSPNLHPNPITSRCTGNIIWFIISYNPTIFFDISSYKIIKSFLYITKKNYRILICMVL